MRHLPVLAGLTFAALASYAGVAPARPTVTNVAAPRLDVELYSHPIPAGTRLFARRTPATATAVVTARSLVLAPTVIRRAAAVRVNAAPRSVQVLRIAVPTSLPTGRDVRWSMAPSRRAEVLSSVAGELPAATADTARGVTVVTRVPATASAGLLPVGEITFTADSVAVVVPVELEVDRIRRASILPSRPDFTALAGQTITLSAEVRNQGNEIDSFTVSTEVPGDWRRVADQQVVLIPGERQTLRFQTRIPLRSGTSVMFPTVRLRTADSVLATAMFNVAVTDPSERSAPVGPKLTVGTSGSVGDSVVGSPAFDFFLSGPLSRKVYILGRAGFAANNATIDRRALGRVGTYLGGTFVSVRGPGWFVTGGNTGANVSNLVGLGAYGRGVSGGITHDRIAANGLVVSSLQGGEIQGGGKVDYLLSRGSIGLGAAHLDDGTAGARSLNAVGLIASFNSGPRLRLTSEVAFRSFEGGSGVGAGFGLERTTRNQVLTLSAQHAPGGSQAFGRALNDMSVAAAQRFGGRASMQANWFTSLDRPPVTGGEYTSTGWNLLPRYDLSENLHAEVEVRRNRYETETAANGGFASTDLSFGTNLRKSGGRYGWLLGGSTTTSERNTVFGSGVDVTVKAQRFGVNVAGTASLPRAIVSTGVEYSQSGSGAGVAPKQARLTFLAQRIQPFSSPMAPLFRTEGEFTSYFGAQPSTFIARIGTEIPVPGAMTLTIDAERNPLLRARGGSTPWIIAFRLERGFGLPWASRGLLTRGAVYQDRNGNGIRDLDEPGLAGVVVRRGSQASTTDAQGRFTLAGVDPVAAEIDPASLPEGVVPPAQHGVTNPGELVLGVVPTGALAIKLIPTADDLGRLPETDRSKLAVLARDAQGAEWYLRADSTGALRFDALPPGVYQFSIDFGGTTERVRQVGEAPQVEIRPGENLPPLELKYTLRAARIFNGGTATPEPGRSRR